MGTKTEARKTMAQGGVPIVPGHEAGASEAASMRDAAACIGYPVLVKASAGGGGKGMRVVHDPRELDDALESAAREAHGAFGDARVYLEKYLGGARHVEVQVFGDARGNVVHLFERECSVQRRHQKVIEESPSPLVDDALREAMGQAAIAAARAVGYTNAGTVEFLVDADRHFYFLEMNTRLQVEHPITELVAGVDLVAAQLAVAAGEALPWRQDDLSQRGHAIEGRVYAEDAAKGHIPQAGRVLLHVPPLGPGIRVDAGIESGSVVPHHYDPMLAKVVVWAENRAAALRRLDAALASYTILGVTTNLSFLRDVARHETFVRGEATTRFLETAFDEWPRLVRGALIDPATGAPLAGCDATRISDATLACVVAAMAEESGLGAGVSRDGVDAAGPGRRPDPWAASDSFRMGEGT
jgi:acetyl/propionyl-CoA carboxylase alpha subunit